MLAKSSDKCQNSVLDKPMWCSRKLNGVRCMMKWNGEKVVTVSRGGKNYDVAAGAITKEVAEFLKEHQDYILDGELYHHGYYLQELSGISRLETWEERCNLLQYHIYDIASDQMQFEKDRLPILDDMRINVFKDSQKVFVLEHVKTNSYNEIKKLHDKRVS